MRLVLIFFALLCANFHVAFAQLVINEVVSSNFAGIADEDGEKHDWIELFNKSESAVQLGNYSMSDKHDTVGAWNFPHISLAAKSHLLVFASGKDKKLASVHSQTIIRQGDTWRYLSSNSMPTGWRDVNYNDTSWPTGKSGFGFGDNDDNTVLNTSITKVMVRKEFQVANPASIVRIIFHIDYDDGYIAFINGKEIARSNNLTVSADYNTVTVNTDREAVMYQGGKPDEVVISVPSSFVVSGKNVLAVQGHNLSSSSSDFTLIPFLTLVSTEYLFTNVESFITVQKSNLHTNFKIKNEGETIYLFAPNGMVADSLPSVSLPADVSYGRYPDGDSRWYYFQNPSPGTTNAVPTEKLMMDSVFFSKTGGYYTAAVKVTLSSTNGKGDIYYSLNGSEPTTLSTKYTGEINVAKTSPLRARVIENGTLGPVLTQTYIIGKSHALPVVSISTDSANLWDYYTGIYVMGPNAQTSNPYFGANFWMDWEKRANVEIYDEQGSKILGQVAGAKVHGGWTRANAQKALAFFARKEYGDGDFDCKVFKDREYDEFDNFVLRASGNDWQFSFMRDGVLNALAHGLNVDWNAFQPSVVYMNGEYWGMQNIREKINENYVKRLYGIDGDALQMLETTPGVVGTNVEYSKLTTFLNTRTTLYSDADYIAVQSMMDVECFLDYFMFQIYIYNRDWPGNNIKYWKTDKPTSKWRWVLYDTDFGFGLYNATEYTENAIEYATSSAGGRNWQNPEASTLLFRKLLSNTEFKNKFINTMADNLNTRFQPARVNDVVDSIKNIMLPEIQNHLKRWGHDYNNWVWQVDRLKTYNTLRIPSMRSHLQSYFNLKQNYTLTVNSSDNKAGLIKLNSLVIRAFPFSGIYFQTVPVQLTAMPNPGYRFVRWEGGSASVNPSIELSLNAATMVRAVFEKTGNESQLLVINEINYKSADGFDTGDWIELHNAGDQVIPLDGWRIEDSNPLNAFTIPAGSIIYPGGYLVLYCDGSKFNRFYPNIRNAVGTVSFDLKSAGETISLYNAGNALIDQVTYGYFTPWPTVAAGFGATLELINPLRDNNEGSNWQPGENGGTPGRINGKFSSSTTPVAIQNEKPSCLPTSFSDYTTLKFCNQQGEKYRIEIIDIAGRVREVKTGTSSWAGMHYVDLFADSGIPYANGVYLVRVMAAGSTSTIRVVKR